MNRDQITSMVRWIVTTFGGFIAGWFAARGYLTYDQVIAILNSDSFIGIIVTAISLVWGLFAHSTTGTIAAAASLPNVKQIIADPHTADVTFKENPKVVSRR